MFTKWRFVFDTLYLKDTRLDKFVRQSVSVEPTRIRKSEKTIASRRIINLKSLQFE